MTAKPSWPEVTKELRVGEVAANRPDLVAIMFWITFEVLLDRLSNEKDLVAQ